MSDPDPGRCPLCGERNRCAMAGVVPPAGGGAGDPCWCTRATIPATLLARVPPAAAGKACICAACANAETQRSARDSGRCGK